MPIDPGKAARTSLLQNEKRRQLAVVTQFERIRIRIESDLADLLRRIDIERRQDGNASPGLLLKKARFTEILDNVTAEINAASARLAAIAGASQSDAIDVAQTQAEQYPALTSELGFFDGPAVKELIDVAGDGGPLDRLFRGISKPVRLAMFEALEFGLAAGSSNAAIAREVRDAIGGGTARAMTIVRTETNRAYREATRKFYAEAPGVIGWRWLAVLDLRTCPICWALHGTVFKTKTKFGTHPNCRCTMVPVFADEPAFITGPEHFAKLNGTQQKAILGPGRYDLYLQGANLRDFVGQVRTPFGIGRIVKRIDLTTFTPHTRTPIEPAPPIKRGAVPIALPKSARGELFPNSKVRNADGTLKPMFHGSTVKIDKFDLGKIRGADLDAPFNGFWFTDNVDHASPALQNPQFIHKAFLNITNPITRIEINALRKTEPALRELSHEEFRLELQRRGFDGVKWYFRPDINADVLKDTGQVDFIDVGGGLRRLIRKGGELEYYRLIDDGRGGKYADFITSYNDLSQFLSIEYDEEIYVAFRPDQIRLQGVTRPRSKFSN